MIFLIAAASGMVSLGAARADSCAAQRLPGAPASACERAAIFTGVLEYSKGPGMSTLSSYQAMEVANAAVSGPFDVEGYRMAYHATNDHSLALLAARSGNAARILTEVKEFSKGAGMSTLSNSQAWDVAEATLRGPVDVGGFRHAYASTSNAGLSLEAARHGNAARIMAEVHEFSRGPGMATLSAQQAYTVADAAQHGSVDVEGFKLAYRASSHASVALEAAQHGRAARILADVMIFSRGPGMPTLSPRQALQVALVSAEGRLDPECFKSSYRSSSNFDVSFAVSVMPLNLGAPAGTLNAARESDLVAKAPVLGEQSPIPSGSDPATAQSAQ